MTDKFYLGQQVLVMGKWAFLTGYVLIIEDKELVVDILGNQTVKFKKSQCVGLPEKQYMMTIEEGYNWWRFGK